MIRAFFLAAGLCILFLGIECLFIDKAIMKKTEQVSAATYFEDAVFQNREYTPAPWAPFSLLAGGVVIILYSFTISRRVRGG